MALKMLGALVGTLDTRTVQPARKTADAIYVSAAWRALMAEIIRERGRVCQDPLCKTPARRGMRVFGDHITELQDGGAPLDKSNVKLRCGSCHTRKTNEQRQRRQAEPAKGRG